MYKTFSISILLYLCFIHWIKYSDAQNIIELRSFQLQSSQNITSGSTGATISQSTYDTTNWLNITAPCTVLACLIQANVYPDNLLLAQNIFSVDTKQFDTSWWYRGQFDLPMDIQNYISFLTFNGIGYRANVWVNGKLLMDNNTLVGTFRTFDIPLDNVSVGGTNIVALEIFRQYDRSLPSDNKDVDLGITFVDWSPVPPDSNMGIWRSTTLTIMPLAAPLSLRYPLVSVTLPPPTKMEAMETVTNATLTIEIDIQNWSQNTINGKLIGIVLSPSGIPLANIENPFTISGKTLNRYIFNDIVINNPQLWWPLGMGNASLHVLNITFISIDTPNALSNKIAFFGIRTVTSKLDTNNLLQFFINGLPILIRGGGWSPDLFLRHDDVRVSAELELTTSMGLNSIRLEGKMEPEFFFDECDKRGILTLPGWCCCDAWQHWPLWKEEQYLVANASTHDQLRRLRIHASIITFFISSDELPPTNVEQMYLNAAQDEHWPTTTISSASARNSTLTGPTGVKMSGPYDWIPPSYWLLDQGQYNLGGAWGFLTEGGPGQNPLDIYELQDLVPKNELWPPLPDDCWDHCGSKLGNFGYLDRFNTALSLRMGGNATNIIEYTKLSAIAAYEGHRAMFEAYSRNKHVGAYGVIQWMLQASWPSNIWHLFTWWLGGGSTYSATKRACAEPLHIMFDYSNNTVWVYSNIYTPITTTGNGWKLTVQANMLALNGTIVYQTSQDLPSIIEADGVVGLMQLLDAKQVKPLLAGSNTYFVQLSIVNGTQLVTDNVYWLSIQPDVLDWSASTWYNTPLKTPANMSDLRTMPNVTLDTSVNTDFQSSITTINVSLSANASSPVFFTRIVLLNSTNDVIRPIYWLDDDHILLLLPGESRTLHAKFDTTVLNGQQPTIDIISWNGQ